MFAPSPHKIFLVQLFSWISILIFYTHVDSTWVYISILFYILYAGAGVALTFHRTLSHRSWVFNPLIKKILIIIASLANVGSAITWVAIHRAHHVYCDTKKDPHSPKFYSWWYIMFGTMFSPISVRRVPDLLRDKFLIVLHKYYYLIQIPWIIFLYYIGGILAIFACHIIPGGLTWLAGSFLNYVNHTTGYKNFNTNDSSVNNYLTGFLVLGEGWHNNHHKNAISNTTKDKWFEFDLIYYIAILLGGKKNV